MKPNVGNIDRAIRFLAAASVAVLYFSGVIGGTAAAILGAAAAVLTITGAVGVCPAYSLIGLSTRKRENEVSKPA